MPETATSERPTLVQRLVRRRLHGLAGKAATEPLTPDPRERKSPAGAGLS
jgi:hypothetical protein